MDLFFRMLKAMSNTDEAIGKLNLSFGVIVFNHFSYQAIVFEWAHIKQQPPDWTITKSATAANGSDTDVVPYFLES